jgi:preprotein translocase subunit SecD
MLVIVSVLLMGCDVFPYEMPFTSEEEEVSGGTRVVLQVPDDVAADDQTLDQIVQTLELRAAALGSADYDVSLASENQIVVDLPSMSNLSKPQLALLSGMGLLEFVDFSTYGAELLEGSCILTDLQVELSLAHLKEGQAAPILDQYTCAGIGVDADPVLANLLPDGTPFYTVMTGAGIDGASAQAQNLGVTQWVVNFSLASEGEGVADFIGYLANQSGRPLAIVLDGRLVSAPTINADLSASAQAGEVDGGVITGRFTEDEAKTLAAQLQSGALPFPLAIVSVEAYQ